MDTSAVSLFNCSLTGLGGANAAQLHAEHCTITNLYLRDQSRFEGNQTTLHYIWSAGMSSTLFVGNLTHTDSYDIIDESRIVRELTILVLDQNDTPITNALVRVYSPTSTLLFEGPTSLEGICVFRLTFVAANDSAFTHTFRCTATFGSANSTRYFVITDLQPLVITLDLSAPPKAPLGQGDILENLSPAPEDSPTHSPNEDTDLPGSYRSQNEPTWIYPDWNPAPSWLHILAGLIAVQTNSNRDTQPQRQVSGSRSRARSSQPCLHTPNSFEGNQR